MSWLDCCLWLEHWDTTACGLVTNRNLTPDPRKVSCEDCARLLEEYPQLRNQAETARR
jgi:hypothetical protein